METTKPKSFKTAYKVGLVFTLVSFIIFLFTPNSSNSSDIFSGVFFINYTFVVGYLIYLAGVKFSYNSPRPNIAYECWINVVTLFTISAFSLNKEMEVFARFPLWLNVCTILMVGLFLVYPYINHLPRFLKIAVYIITGFAFLLSVYMFIYLIPLAPLSFIASFFLGISLHTFVPALWLWIIIDFLLRKNSDKKLKHFLWIGALIPCIILAFYVMRWNMIQVQVKDILSEKNMQLSNQLPSAIQLAQKLPSDPLTEEILVSPFRSQRFFGDDIGMNGGGENKFHDPLSLVAIAFLGDLDIDKFTVETILNIRRDYRHKTTQKLWTGISLSTTSIANNIRVFPDYRLAYHEKTFVIHNDPDKNRNAWFINNTEEALYTFHVPEGSIVTSLSLWIDGKEQKSRLSTMQKADSAYTEIVGVQRRDPAIAHWQEGNKITVNVFPCTSTLDRTFKIGFTTPLTLKDGHLWLKNIWFEGPDFNSAREATSIVFENNSTAKLPDYFEKDAKGAYIYKGDYMPDWQIEIDPVALSQNKFSFNGYDYTLKEIQFENQTITAKKIFLDITKDWNKEEYDSIINAFANKEIYTWLPENVKITADNKEKAWEEVRKNQFSIPFLYDISDPENSVVITKSEPRSPILADLKGSDYAEKTTQYLVNAKYKITLINIGNELSPFWKSLRELRLIDYNESNLKTVISNINSGKLNFPKEDSSMIALSGSHMTVIKQAADSLAKGASKAPDHLLRIFAYNDVLRKIGKRYFEKEKYENELFREAEEGYVVTPVTCMIVLETEADYDKAGIKKNKDTVGNAGILSGGAVPEPHEWLLIGLVFILIVRHLYSKYKKLQWR